MKRKIVVSIITVLCAALLLSLPALAEEKSNVKNKARWTSELRVGGVTFYDDAFQKVFNEQMFFMGRYILGYQILPNLELSGGVGGMNFTGKAKSASGKVSGEKYSFWLVPLQANLGYRFDFVKDQPVVPFISGGYDYWYFQENNQFKNDVKGDKTGYHADGGVAILLDKLDPNAAKTMKNDWNVQNTYLTISAEYLKVGEQEKGIDFSNWQYCVGIMMSF